MRKYTYKLGASVLALTLTLVGLTGSPATAAVRPLAAALLVRSDLPRGYTQASPPIDDWFDLPPANFGECRENIPQQGDPTRTHMAEVVFNKSPANTMSLAEVLALVGGRNARDAVAATGAAWRNCPSIEMITLDGTHEIVETHQMAAPRLGDAAAGARLVVRLRAGGPAVQYLDVIVVAWHGVFSEVFLVGAVPPDRHELTRIAAGAVAKLKRVR